MTLRSKAIASIALAATLTGCAGLFGGGGKAPATLLDLTSDAAVPAQMNRSAVAGQVVTIAVPVVAKELRTVRVPVQVSPTSIQYVANLQWVDTPDRLFQQLLSETVRRSTNRVVLDGMQGAFDPGVLVSGQLRRFGYDAATGNVIVEYDASLSVAGGTRVDTRRFTAAVPASGTAATVGPALNSAANQVANEVAAWIGNSSS